MCDSNIPDFMEALADSASARRWDTAHDVDLFVACWVTMGHTLESCESFSAPDAAVALSNALLVFALGAAEDPEGTWDEFFVHVSETYVTRSFGASRDDVTEPIIENLRNLVNESCDSNRILYQECWDPAIWSGGDSVHLLDWDAMDAVVGVHAHVFGELMKAFSPETRNVFAEEVRELVGSLREEIEKKELELLSRANRPVRRKKAARRRQAPPRPREASVHQDAKIERNSPDGRSEPWVPEYERILARRAKANRDNLARGQDRGRFFFSDGGADYLAESVARVLQMRPIPADMTPLAWARSHPDQVVVIDASRIVKSCNGGLENAPQSSIRGRLRKMQTYFPRAGKVGVRRLNEFGLVTSDGEPIESRFAVLLYRTGSAGNTTR